MMNTITGTLRGGRIVPDAPVDWPDGTKVEINRATRADKIGIDESEWRDDAEALADWKHWIETFEPLEFTPEEEAEMKAFAAKMREFNIEAVRRQMEEGWPE
jgi:hypothetical protein